MDSTRRDLLISGAAAAAVAWLRPWDALAQALPPAPPIREVEIRQVSPRTLRLLLRRVADAEPIDDGAVVAAAAGTPVAVVRRQAAGRTVRAGELEIRIGWDPLRIQVQDRRGTPVQELTAAPDGGQFSFPLGDGPLFGLGEGGPQFSRRGALDRMVSGSGGYRLGTNGSKVPIQWLIGGGAGGSAWGLFLHRPLGYFDLRNEPGVFLVGPAAPLPRPGRGGASATPGLPPPAPPAPTMDDIALDVFVCAGNPPGLLGEYAAITGHPEMPPLWSLGYLQSHRTLGEPAEILQEAATFREKRLPCDAMIYLGTGFCPNGWNTANGSFEWNPRAFPDPAAALAALHRDNFKAVVHVVLDGSRLTGAATDPCDAPVPPLPQVPERAIGCYWPYHKPLFDLGVDGWWPDEGDGYDAPSRLLRNRMYFEGSQMYRPNRRVFALHRNGYAGMQRYASFLWSGDVQSTWTTLKTQIATGINAGLSGIPLWGTDVGGFVPTAEYTGELYARWFQFGAFCPLFRSHGRDWRLHLPWGWNTGTVGFPETPGYRPSDAELHNAAIEPVCRKYLELRYRLLPYLYAAVREGCDTGLPVIRALWLDHADDPIAAAREDQYLFGRELLVAPVYEKGVVARAVYLPRGDWYDFWTNERVTGGREISRAVDLETMPLYVRAGAILPLGPVKQHTAETSDEPLRLVVHAGADGAATLYEDDGASFDYRRGASMKIDAAWQDRARRLTLRLAPGAKLLPPAPRALVVQLAGSTSERTVSFTGKALSVDL